MDSDKKEDCKYWDKCYQKNEYHLQKYNHPERQKIKVEPQSTSQTSNADPPKEETTSKEKEVHTKKRKSSDGPDVNESPPKKSNPNRLWQSPAENISEPLQSNKFIHAKFLVKMPKDFYLFWDFASTLITATIKNPFSKVNLELVGPFDFMAGRFNSVDQKSPGEYLRHWRFFYDPPEFQTIFVKKGTGVHYGYWRDDPKEEENLLIARNDAEKGCEFEFIGTNTFDALAYYLEKDFAPTPFTQGDLHTVRKAINEFVSVNKIERNPLHNAKTDRWKTIAAKTFHGAGIVVPVNTKSTVGYRPLIESDSNLKKILSLLDKDLDDMEAATSSVMEKLQPIITAAVIALDECDFGTSLELGIDLFCSGHEQLHPIIQKLLISAYTLLGRPQLLAILKAHLDDRRKSLQLSILD